MKPLIFKSTQYGVRGCICSPLLDHLTSVVFGPWLKESETPSNSRNTQHVTKAGILVMDINKQGEASVFSYAKCDLNFFSLNTMGLLRYSILSGPNGESK